MSVLDVYVAPDEEFLTFDDAETGVRTLLQNQPDGGFMGRMRAASIARMIVVRPAPGPSLGVPWIAVRRKVLTGDHRVTTRSVDVDASVANVQGREGREGLDANANANANVDSNDKDRKRAAGVAVAAEAHNGCVDTVDAGTTAEYLDRIIDIYKAKFGDDTKSRRLAAAMSPLALPEAVGGVQERTAQLYRERDVEGLLTSDCSGVSPFQTVRLLCRDKHVPADSVQQRGIAFTSGPLPVQTADASPAMIEALTFDLVKYIAHVLTLKNGETVSVMLDVPTTSVVLQTAEWPGRLQQTSKNNYTVKLDGGVRVLTNTDGNVHVNLDDIRASDGFIYGTAWKGPKFSRTLVSGTKHPITLIPWAKTSTQKNRQQTEADDHLTQLSLVSVVQPDFVHTALAKEVSQWNTTVEALFDRDDVALDIHETRVVALLIEKAIDLDSKKSNTLTTEASNTSEVPPTHANEHLDNQAFLLMLKDWLKSGPKGNKQVGGKPQAPAQKTAQVQAEDGQNTCSWGPSTVLEGLANDCLKATDGGNGMSGMGQGHILSLHDYVETTVPVLTVKISNIREQRDTLGREEKSDLSTSAKTIMAGTRLGALRLDDEIKHGTISFDAVPSPFDVYRSFDVERWVNETVHAPKYESYKGNEETAFEADIAATRVLFEDRGFYHKFDNPENTDAQASSKKDAADVAAQTLPSTAILFDMLIEACNVQGMLESEIASVIRNTRHYRSDDDTAIKVRKRIEMVKRARNRPEFRQKSFASRTALERRLVERVRTIEVRDHSIAVMHMLGALLVMIVRQSKGRVVTNMRALTAKKESKKRNGDDDSHVSEVASGVQQIVRALLPPERDGDAIPMHDHVSSILADIQTVTEDKRANGVSLVVEDDRLDAVARPRAVRDTPWPHFRPMMSNIAERRRQGHKISSALKLVADMQKPYLKASPLILVNENRPAKYNVCCVYRLPGSSTSQAVSQLVSEAPHSQAARSGSRSRSSSAKFLKRVAPRIITLLKGTTATSRVEPIKISKYVGEAQEILLTAAVKKDPAELPGTWMEDALRSFLDVNMSYASDDALSRITSGNNAKVAWSALASQNLARFEEMSSKVELGKDRIENVKNSLLVPTISSDGVQIQEQQFQARLFLKGIIVPLLGRLSNNVRGHADLDRDASRLNAIMGAHEPGADVTTLRSTLSSYGDVRSGDLLMLAAGPLKNVTALRASVQLLMGVALTALWRVLADTGAGPLGSTIVKPIILLALDRLAMSLKFSLADDSVTRLIQDQREDKKNRKIEIYNKILPDDLEFVKELRLIKKDEERDLFWDQIEREYATVTESAARTDGAMKVLNEKAQQQTLEIGALGAYPDDDREVADEDADQEMMDYVD